MKNLFVLAFLFVLAGCASTAERILLPAAPSSDLVLRESAPAEVSDTLFVSPDTVLQPTESVRLMEGDSLVWKGESALLAVAVAEYGEVWTPSRLRVVVDSLSAVYAATGTAQIFDINAVSDSDSVIYDVSSGIQSVNICKTGVVWDQSGTVKILPDTLTHLITHSGERYLWECNPTAWTDSLSLRFTRVLAPAHYVEASMLDTIPNPRKDGQAGWGRYTASGGSVQLLLFKTESIGQTHLRDSYFAGMIATMIRLPKSPFYFRNVEIHALGLGLGLGSDNHNRAFIGGSGLWGYSYEPEGWTQEQICDPVRHFAYLANDSSTDIENLNTFERPVCQGQDERWAFRWSGSAGVDSTIIVRVRNSTLQGKILTHPGTAYFENTTFEGAMLSLRGHGYFKGVTFTNSTFTTHAYQDDWKYYRLEVDSSMFINSALRVDKSKVSQFRFNAVFRATSFDSRPVFAVPGTYTVEDPVGLYCGAGSLPLVGTVSGVVSRLIVRNYSVPKNCPLLRLHFRGKGSVVRLENVVVTDPLLIQASGWQVGNHFFRLE